MFVSPSLVFIQPKPHMCSVGLYVCMFIRPQPYIWWPRWGCIDLVNWTWIKLLLLHYKHCLICGWSIIRDDCKWFQWCIPPSCNGTTTDTHWWCAGKRNIVLWAWLLLHLRLMLLLQGSQFLKSLEKYTHFYPFLEKSGKVWKSLESRT